LNQLTCYLVIEFSWRWKIWIELPGTKSVCMILWARGNEAWSEIILKAIVSLWRMVSNQTSFPSTPSYICLYGERWERIDLMREEERTDWFWFGHALFFMVRYILQDGKMCGSCKHGVLLGMAPSILSNFSHTFYVYMFHGIEYFTLFFLFQVNHL